MENTATATMSEKTLTKEDVRAKIAKLMALSTSPVEAEASAALLKAQSLMMKYNLSQAEIIVDENDEEADEFMRNAPVAVVDADWKAQLINGLAGIFDCFIYRQKVDKSRSMIKCYGNGFDISVFLTVYYKMLDVIEQLGDAAMVQAKIDGRIGYNRGVTMAFKRSWFLGCVTRLVTRIKDQKAAQMAQDNACRALVIKKEEFNKKMLHEDGIRLKTITKNQRFDSDAYARGQSAGNGIALNPQLQ